LIPINIVIFPYLLNNDGVTLMSQNYLRDNYPKGWNYFLENRKELENREKGRMKGGKFYAYIYPKNLSEFNAKKIMTPYMANTLQFNYDSKGNLYHTTKVYSIAFKENIDNDLFYLGILNSKILLFYIKNTGTVFRGDYYVFATEFLKNFPLPNFDLSSSEIRKIHDNIIKLVDNLLHLNKDLHAATLTTQREQIQRAIDHTERKIDELVYELYGLSEEEMRIVEGV